MECFFQILIIGFINYIVLTIYYNGKSVGITKYEIIEKELDERLDGLKILQVSDLQSDIFGKNQSKIKEQIKDLDIDIIVITGDFIDRNHTRYDVADETMELLLTKNVPIIFIEGNHETCLDKREYANFIKRWESKVVFLFDEAINFILKSSDDSGISLVSNNQVDEAKFLMNIKQEISSKNTKLSKNNAIYFKEINKLQNTENRLINDDLNDVLQKKHLDVSLQIVGISEELINKNRDYNRNNPVRNHSQIIQEINSIYEDSLGEENKNKPYRILLTHEPQIWSIYEKTKADLTFAGHSHGGQFRIPFIGGLYSPEQGIFPKLTNGVIKSDIGKNKLVISRGLGNSRFPIRLLNNPELVVVELKSTN